MEFCLESPVLKCHQELFNSCYLSILASVFGDNRVVTALVNHIEDSLTLETDKFKNRIYFSNNFMKNRMHIKVKQRLRYNLKIWHKNDAFDIIKKIS